MIRMETQLTGLLHRWRHGDRAALDQMMPLVYEQLRHIAERHMSAAGSGHTLRTTALVHEAYLKMMGSGGAIESRAHFFAVAARAMRHVLADHARAHSRGKRGGGIQRIPFEESLAVTPDGARIVEIDESLRRLEEVDERKARTIELLFFGGLTYKEAAEVLNISEATLHRELKLAKAWLHRDLNA
jgi:RNA polymerase sigma factor (TIGR02999 family)